ncbi:hypothetical protein RQP46_004100 [Phenoliferia psychrophenolica]
MHAVAVVLALLGAVSAAPVDNGASGPLLVPRSTYPNPIALQGDKTGVHDPSIVKTPEGGYLLFGSGGWGMENKTNVGNGIPTWSSLDRITWTLLGAAFETPPADTDHYTGATSASLWAPDVTYISGEYYMYYSASASGSQISAILLATSRTGLPGTWEDKGVVVATDDGDDWNAIDPHLIVADNAWYLSAGSYWSGIKLLDLNPSTGFLDGSVVTSLAKRTVNNGAEEGSFIYFNAPYYYLFTSWDNCCDGSPTPSYNMRVTRSKEIKGPYVGEGGTAALDGGGSVVLVSHDAIYGPGGQGLLNDKDGLIIYYHYLTGGTTVPVLGINHLTFGESGWPMLT